LKKIKTSETLWVEKYRPQTVEDLVIPADLKEKLMGYIAEGKLPNLLLYSNQPGTGKTSLVNSITKDLNADVLWINGSKDSGIDVMRTRVVDFGVSESIDGSLKVIVVDESDGLSEKSQASLRGILEEFSNNVSFIFTCNYVDKIIPAVADRFIKIDFDDLMFKHKKEVAAEQYKRLCWVLENEGVEYDKKELQNLVVNFYPAMRSMTMTLQKHTFQDKLDLSSAVIDISQTFKIILSHIKNKDFSNLRKEFLSISEPSGIYSFVFKTLDEFFLPKSQPQVIVLCAKYQDMNSSARDKTICAVAFCVELMGTPGIEML
jgi:DNA polymerase III delta prime subunit